MFDSFMHLNHQMNVPVNDLFMRGIHIIQYPLLNDPKQGEDHFDERLNKSTLEPIPVDHLVLHCSSEPDIERVLKTRNCISAHYVIHADGAVLQCVDESKRAYHAGASCWANVGGRDNNMNAHSIGIEIENPTFGAATSYTRASLKTLMALCRSIISRHHIPAHNVIGHSDVAPLRKADPGRLFPWKMLAKEGIGLYPEENESETTGSNDPKELLKQIGYNTENIPAAMQAFKRHFMPQNLQYEATGADRKAAHQFMEHYEDNMKRLLPEKITVTTPELRRLQTVARAYQLSRSKARS